MPELPKKRVIEYCAMIREELHGLCDAAKGKTWVELLLKLADVLYLVCSLIQEAGLETVLSAAFSLKHVADMKKSYSSRKDDLERASKLVPQGLSAAGCVQEAHSGRLTLCVNGKIVRPPDIKNPDAESLVQVVKAERGNSELSCIIDQDSKEFLKAVSMGHTAESCPSDFTLPTWLCKQRSQCLR